MPQLNYLVVERPFYITSTGYIEKCMSYFVYSSTKSQFTDRSFLEGIYKNINDLRELISRKCTFERSNYMVDESRVDEAYEFVLDYIDDHPTESIEVALVQAMEEYDLDYEEMEVLEKRSYSNL